MDLKTAILSLSGLLVILIIIAKSRKVFRLIGQAFMKLMIGALLLFFLNAIGNQFGLYVPINFVTAFVSGFLGLPGVAALSAIQLWVLA